MQILVPGSRDALLVLPNIRGGPVMFTTKIDWELDYNQGERYWK